ncbi:MAG: hypothetical protein FJ293_10960 [Planctomycetes bacterium]|nr:hypothetical protein [Planctomycetota bacterium]
MFLSSTALCCLALAPEVVELTDGSRLAGELRTTKTGVVLTSPLGRLEIAHAQIARIERRNELLARHTAGRAAAGEKPHAWLALAGLALDHGLYAEAFDAFDQAAAYGATAASLRELRQRLQGEALLDGVAPALPPADDAARRKLLARVAGDSASRAEFATALLRAGEPQAVESFLLARLASGAVGERRAAARLLAESPSFRSLGKLIRASLIDADDEVRRMTRTAALASGHPDLAVPYLTALATDDARLRDRAYPALEAIRDPRVVDGLIAMFEPRAAAGGTGGAAPARAHVFFGEQQAFVRDFDVEVAQGAVIAKPVIGVLQSGVLLDAAVAGVHVVRMAERQVALGALRRLTGADFGVDAAAWRAWWARQGGTLPPIAGRAN